jgi:hypothetical protein
MCSGLPSEVSSAPLRLRSASYGLTKNLSDGQSEYLEVTIDIREWENPIECIERLKILVKNQLNFEEEDEQI